MNKKIDRLKRQQQRLWRKAAVSILSLHHNLVISLSFLMLIVLGTFWILVDQKLEAHLLQNARAYGYSITSYAATDLRELILSEDSKSYENYLQRLTEDPLILEATLFNHQGKLLAKSTLGAHKNETTATFYQQSTLTLLEDINLDKMRIGIVQLKLDKKRLEAPIEKLLNSIAIITVFTMIIAIIFAWFLSKRLTRPLRKLLKFPLNTPEDSFIDNLDVSSELKLMLENSSITNDSPAPVSNAERAGIHQLLAVDSIAESADVIILKLYLCDLDKWLKLDSSYPNVRLLRQLDRLIILTIHSQQGHLLSFDGITAQACFGLDGNASSAAFRAASCSLLLKTLLDELSLDPKICLRKEERLLIRHLKRTPVAIPVHAIEDESDILYSNTKLWLLLHKNLCSDERLQEQIKLKEYDQTWMTIENTRYTTEAMIARQLAWIRYLLASSDND